MIKLLWPDQKSKITVCIINLSLVFTSIVITLIGLELFFRFFFAQPDAFDHTYAFKNWQDRYWGETNSLGYRDKELSWEDVADRHAIMVLGDSIVAGYGIERQEDRMSNRLGRLLGDDFVVMTVAKPGWDTLSEAYFGAQYPFRFDTLILVYTIDDIRGVGKEVGIREPDFISASTSTGWQKPLVDHSYLYNFVYWRLYRYLRGTSLNTEYWNWMHGLYEHPLAWKRHTQNLLTIKNYVEDKSGQMLVVIFPDLMDPRQSDTIVNRVEDLFLAENVPVVNVRNLFWDIPSGMLVASPVDGHPNERVHQRVAQELYTINAHNFNRQFDIDPAE